MLLMGTGIVAALLAQAPTAAARERIFIQACQEGVDAILEALPVRPKDGSARAKGLSACAADGKQLRAAGELDEVGNLIEFSCGYAGGNMLGRLGIPFDPKAPSPEFMYAVGKCAARAEAKARETREDGPRPGSGGQGASETRTTLARHGSTQAPVSLPELVKTAGQAVVLLRSFDASGRQIGLGSGFVVAGGRVVTNAHVLAGAARLRVYDAENQLVGAVDHAEALGGGVDLAVLPALQVAQRPLRPGAREPQVGESIVVIGAPEGLANTVTTGIVSAYREDGGERLMQISAPISQGSSGGPVLNMQGEVVGVSVAVLRQGQNLNFAVPLRDLQTFLRRQPEQVPLPGAATRAPAASMSPSRENQDELLRRLPRLLDEQPVTGALVAADEGVDLYTVNATSSGIFRVGAVSKDFDVRLAAMVRDADGEFQRVADDDDGGGGTNALMSVRIERPGLFLVGVSSATKGGLGTYRVGVFAPSREVAKEQPPADATRMVRISETTAQTYYLDLKSVQRTAEGLVRAAQWTGFQDRQVRGDASFDTMKTLYEIDCTGRRYRALHTATYDKGTRVSQQDQVSGWMVWTALTVVGDFSQRACRAAEK